MYTQLFTPVLQKVHRCSVEEVKHSTQKERRIIETLEPVLATHRLIVDPKVIKADYDSCQAYEADNKFTKSLFYQLTRVTLDRGSLKHDDRLDVLAMAVGYWVESMARDQDSGIKAEQSEALQKELEHFMDNALGRNTSSNTRGWNPVYGR